MNTNVKVFISVIVLLVLGTVATAIMRGGGGGVASDGKYDTFATCLKDSGATFFGAFWCPHCQNTKKLFGSSQKLLPYEECSTANGQGQLQVCIDKQISSYPTWEFANKFTLESDTPAYKCTGGDGDPELCEKNYKPGRTAWLVGPMALSVLSDPTQEGTKWTFPELSRMYGEISLENLSKVSSCVLATDEATIPPVVEEGATSPTQQ
jgi:hypothetical protein